MSKETENPPGEAPETNDQVTRDQIVEDLRRTISDARAYLEQIGAEGKDRARATATQTQDQMQEWCDQCKDMVRRKPLTSVGIALGIGWIIGKLGD